MNPLFSNILHDVNVFLEHLKSEPEIIKQQIQKITDLLQQDISGSIATRRHSYEQAYTKLKKAKPTGQPLAASLRPLLFILLNRYAIETCYHQQSTSIQNSLPDQENGFRAGVRLLELAWVMECDELHNKTDVYPWHTCEDMQDLILLLSQEWGSQQWKADEWCHNLAPDQLVNALDERPDMREEVIRTLQGLLACYRNIPEYQIDTPANRERQTLLSDLIKIFMETYSERL